MPFQTAYVPVNIAPDGTYILTAQVVYKGRDQTFTVPAGFTTDLASVPRFLTWLVPVAGIQDRAAIVHDWMCVQLEAEHRSGATLVHGERTRSILRDVVGVIAPANARDTDGIFRRILRELGVPLVRRWLMWAGVRWGALFNPARRPGWLRTAPAVLGVTMLALPFLLLPAVCVGLVLLIDTAVEAIR